MVWRSEEVVNLSASLFAAVPVTYFLRLLKSPNLVVIGLSVGYETWPSNGWHHPFLTSWYQYRLELPSAQMYYGHTWLLGISTVSQTPVIVPFHSPNSRLMPAVRAVQGDCENVFLVSRQAGHRKGLNSTSFNELLYEYQGPAQMTSHLRTQSLSGTWHKHPGEYSIDYQCLCTVRWLDKVVHKWSAIYMWSSYAKLDPGHIQVLWQTSVRVVLVMK